MPPVISMLALSARPAGVAVFWPREGRFSNGAWCLKRGSRTASQALRRRKTFVKAWLLES